MLLSKAKTKTKTKKQVLDALAREYKLRISYYNKQVGLGKMKQVDAQHGIDCMLQAIEMIKEYVPDQPGDQSQMLFS